MNHGKIFRAESVCSYVTYTWLAASNQTSETAPIRAPVYPVYGVRQTNNGCVQAYFSFPLLPLPYFDPSTSPFESFFDSPQLAVSFNVQIFRIAKFACFLFLFIFFSFHLWIEFFLFSQLITCLANYSQLPYSRPKRAGFKQALFTPPVFYSGSWLNLIKSQCL